MSKAREILKIFDSYPESNKTIFEIAELNGFSLEEVCDAFEVLKKDYDELIIDSDNKSPLTQKLKSLVLVQNEIIYFMFSKLSWGKD